MAANPAQTPSRIAYRHLVWFGLVSRGSGTRGRAQAVSDDNSEQGANDAENGQETIFFSYSRKDKLRALPIIRAIEGAGYSVWWDGKLEGGTTFLDMTENALEGAKAVVVLWSQNSVGSHWVRDEATSGRERSRLIPLTLDGTMPPLGFRQVQVIDMRQWHRKTPAFEDLLQGLAKLHDRAYSPPDQGHRHLSGPSARGLSRRHVFMGAGALLGAAGVAAIYQVLPRGAGPANGQGLVVLPFENIGGDEALDYIADGLASAIRDRLSMNGALKVIARSSSQAVVKTHRDALDIAKNLGVSHILEGRVEALGNAVTITVGLVDGVSGFSEWTEVLSYDEDHLLGFRDRIINKVVTTLSRDPDETDAGDTQNADAFNEYMKGVSRLSKAATLDNIQLAQAHYERAVDLDPTFSKALSALSQIYLILGAVNADAQLAKALIDRAVQTAQKAVDISPDTSESHATLGFVLMSGLIDFDAAKAPFAQAVALGMNRPSDLTRHATYLTATGQSERAIAQAQRVRDLDPLSATAAETLAFAHFGAGQFDQASRIYRGILALDAKRYTTRSRLGLSLIYGGDIDAGLAECQTEANLMEKHPCEAIGQARKGNLEAAQDALDDLIRTFGDAGAYQQAEILTQMGRLDEAMETLLRAEALRDSGLSLAKMDPALAPLRGRGDFKALLARLGLPQ